jgi:hypothetical protein
MVAWAVRREVVLAGESGGRLKFDEPRLESAARSPQAASQYDVFADEEAVAVDDERSADHGPIGEVLAPMENGVRVTAKGTSLSVSLGREQSRWSTFVDRGPSWDELALPSQRAEPDAFPINEIADLIKPVVRDKFDDMVARPTHFILAIWWLGDGYIDSKAACIDMDAAIRRSADPVRKWNRSPGELAGRVSLAVEWNAIVRLRGVP